MFCEGIEIKMKRESRQAKAIKLNPIFLSHCLFLKSILDGFFCGTE
jgi:hypothetical protein